LGYFADSNYDADLLQNSNTKDVKTAFDGSNCKNHLAGTTATSKSSYNMNQHCFVDQVMDQDQDEIECLWSWPKTSRATSSDGIRRRLQTPIQLVLLLQTPPPLPLLDPVRRIFITV
jgi:hypothetical protein